MKIHPLTPPFRVEPDGNIYVGSSGVLLDTIVNWFTQGMSPDEIAANYDTVTRAEVYGVVAYYLRHAGEVDEYLRERVAAADEVRHRIEAAEQPWLAQMKAKIDAARAQRDARHASSAG
jgi:uncharacterized protein (DUF433 family)